MARAASKAPATAVLAGDPEGNLVEITQTATPGNQLYEVQAVGAVRDRVRIYATNNSSAAVDLTIEWMGTTNADKIVVSVPPKNGLELVAEGWVRNASTGSKATIAAFAASASVINVHVVAESER
jgi:hypothetical protein